MGHLPQDIVDSDQIEDIIRMINDMGIQVSESAPDADELLMQEANADEDAAEAAAQALATVESEIGRTTDPVRMYMREMGTVDLLTREGEIPSPSVSKKVSATCSMPWLTGRVRCSSSLTSIKKCKMVKRNCPMSSQVS